MTDLEKELKNIRAEYETVFLQTAKEIDVELSKLPENSKKNYLANRFNSKRNDILETISAEHKKYHCAGCGVCCKFAVSEFSPEELAQKAQNGDKFASQFIKTFVPYESVEEAAKIYPEYISFLEGNIFYVYHCPKVTKDNRCPDYENRPQICKDFPDNPIAFLPKSCAYYDWKVKTSKPWLILNAEAEIISYYLSNVV